MAAAVAEVDQQADDQPNSQSRPVGPAQAIDHGAADDDAEYRHQWQRRNLESSLDVRTAVAQDPYARAYQDEREQGPDAGHLAHDVFGQEGAEQRGENKEQ